MNIKRYKVRGGRSGLEEAGGPAKTDRQVVLLSDHIASHAYDEAKERELFEDWIPSFWNKRKHLDDDSDWIYADDLTQGALIGWLECAKSRARSAE